MRYALISGTSTGIGRAFALRLVREGITVFAGVRKPEHGTALESAATSAATNGARLIPLRLDVTSAEQVSEAVTQVRRVVGNQGLWAVINNAGIVVPGPVEFVTAADWRKQFEVNLFGVVELTQQTLPLLREAVPHYGRFGPRIMIVSSIAGRVGQPFLAPYSASKFAVSSLGDSLRLELHRQGIGVTVIEPGAIKTEIWDKGKDQSEGFTPDHPALPLYGQDIRNLAKLAQKAAENAIPVDKAVDAATNALLAKRAPARVLIGPDAKIVARLRKYLPLSMFDGLLRKQFGIPN